MTRKDGLKQDIELAIYNTCQAERDGNGAERFYETSSLRIKGLDKLNIDELDQLLYILSLNK
jgi:hypothetical protein